MMTIKKLMAVLVLAGRGAGTVHAQDGPARPPAAPVQAPAATGVLTDAGLKDKFKALGYETRA